MKHEYIEGQKAKENFEEGMKSLFMVPKNKVAKLMKKAQSASSQRKTKKKKSDKD
jgi:hypothetical protein